MRWFVLIALAMVLFFALAIMKGRNNYDEMWQACDAKGGRLVHMAGYVCIKKEVFL